MAQTIQFVTASNAANATAFTGIPESLNFTVGGQCADGGASIIGAICIGQCGIGFNECVLQAASGVVAISFTDLIPLDFVQENLPLGGASFTIPSIVSDVTSFSQQTSAAFTIAASSDTSWPAMASGTVSGLCAQGQQNFVIGEECVALTLETKSVVIGSIFIGACLLTSTSMLGGESIRRCAAEFNGCQLTRTPPPPPPPPVPIPNIPPPTPGGGPGPGLQGHQTDCQVLFYKHPSDILDYSLDWTGWLVPGDSIIASAWASDVGLTIVSTSISGARTIAQLSGGTNGTTYSLRNSVATQLGRIEVRSSEVIVVMCGTTPPDPPALARKECFRVIIKNPAQNADIQIDWASWLGTDVISNSTWTADPGVTVSGSSFSKTSTVVRISGGMAATDYTITNTITTQQGRTEVRHVLVQARVC